MNIIGYSGLHDSVAFKRAEFPHLNPELYRLVQGLDSAAALVTPGGIAAAAAEERFTGEKKTGCFPAHSIHYCLKAAGLVPDEVDYVAHGFSYEPLRSFYEQSDFTLRQFQHVYSRQAQLKCLEEYFPGWVDKLIQVPHHLAHAASAFYLSGFSESLILVTDGMGELHSATLAVGTRDGIQILRQLPGLYSLGIFYGVLTMYLGFEVALDEYKVMGLAPYGDSRRFYPTMMDLVQFQDDGTYQIPVLLQNKTVLEKETYGGTMQVLIDAFGEARVPGSEITQRHMDIAAALQAVLQACLLRLLRHFKAEAEQVGTNNLGNHLCMAGGVALNCTANGVIRRSKMFKNIFIQPAAGDDGTAPGAALYVQRQSAPHLVSLKMNQPLWGPEFGNGEIEQVCRARPEVATRYFASFDELAADTAQRLASGQVIAWFQGRMEFGPRALGNRSILADPRDPEMRDRVNQLVKQRESFRPFAPAVTAERASEFFEVESDRVEDYAYMILVARTRAAYRSRLPAVTHVDGSARVQTVSKEGNARFWTLLRAFEHLTEIPVLLNTSFNVRGQPIVCDPLQAVDTFLRTSIDALVIHNFMVTRAQPG